MLPHLHPIITETPIHAQITQNGYVYADKTLRKPITEVFAGGIVEVLEDYSEAVYKIKTTDHTGWVSAKLLLISPETPTDKSKPTPRQLESFVNAGGYKSPTNHLVLVDINRQKTHIFQGEQGNWVLAQSFCCSTGTNKSPTTRGIFTLTTRGDWFYSHRLHSGAKYWIRFNGHYLFHSTPMDEGGKPLAGENIVGEKRSNGCVRLLLPDIKWIYDNVPDGTVVVII